MKTNKPIEDDRRLSELLREWKVDASLPPRFREQVWQRIEQPEKKAMPNVWGALRHWIEIVLPRPAMAVSYVAVLLAIGAGVGWTEAQSETKRADSVLGMRYVQSVDPFQAVTLASNR
jgi:hypothetical protein